MPEKFDLPLPWPALGVDRRLAYRWQRPYSTPDCLNVELDDIYEDRARGGSRIGSIKAFEQLLGGGAEVNMMGSVRSVPTLLGAQAGQSQTAFWLDNFNNVPMQDVWVAMAPAPLPETYLPPHPFAGLAVNTKPFGEANVRKAASRIVLPGWDKETTYYMGIQTVPSSPITTRGYLGTYDLYVLMDENSPSISNNGIQCRLDLDSSAAAQDTNCVVNFTMTPVLNGIVYPGTEVVFTAVETPATSRFFKVIIFTNVLGQVIQVTASWGGISLGQIVLDTIPGWVTGGHRFGFGMNPTHAPNPLNQIELLTDYFKIIYHKFIGADSIADIPPNRNVLVVSAGSILYRNSSDDPTVLEVTDHQNPDETNIEEDRTIMSAQMNGRLYIGDHGPLKVRGDSASVDNTTGILTDSTVDFNTADIDIDNDCLVLSHPQARAGGGDGTSGVVPDNWVGAYALRIVSFTATTMTFKKYDWPIPCTVNCYAGAGLVTGVSYRVERCPKVYDPINNTLRFLWEAEINNNINIQPLETENWPASVFSDKDIEDHGIGAIVSAGDFKGTFPVGCPIVSRWRGRLVWCGFPDFPHHWIMSREGNPYDYFLAYPLDDTGRPVSAQSTEGGVIGEPITAFVPATEDYALFATLSELWTLRGNPASNGLLDKTDFTVGIVGRLAWCYGPSGNIFLLSRDGLYTLAAGSGQFASSISKERMPLELTGIDIGFYVPQLGYNISQRRVEIWLTPKVQVPQTHMYYNNEQPGFWPFKYPSEMEPWSLLDWEGDTEEERSLLIGGRDGYIRKWSRTVTDDDGTQFNSHVLFGPFQLGRDDFDEGLLNELVLALAEVSGPITWHVYVGDTPEAAFRAFEIEDEFDAGDLTAGLNVNYRPRARGHSLILKLSSP